MVAIDDCMIAPKIQVLNEGRALVLGLEKTQLSFLLGEA
jgi:hypothetical protein